MMSSVPYAARRAMFVTVGVLAGAACVAGPVAAQQASAGKPALFAVLEGGWNCAQGENLMPKGSGRELGDNGCGGTGLIGVGQTNANLGGGFNAWAINVRRSATHDSLNTVAAGTGSDLGFRERRTVIDAEIGRPFSLLGSWFGETTDLTLGLRYAHYRGNIDFNDLTGGAVTARGEARFAYSGIGPRVGMNSTLVLNPQWRLVSEGAVAVLFGRQSYKEDDFNGAGALTSSTSLGNSGTVVNYDSTYAVTYALSGHKANGIEITAGLRQEYWFNQLRVKGLMAGDPVYERDRNSIGPFARVRVPLQ